MPRLECISHGEQFIKLMFRSRENVDQKDLPLIVLTEVFDSECWYIEDLRLRESTFPNPFWYSAADTFYATADAPAGASEAIRARLRDYQETALPGGGSRFVWCTYDGIVPGAKGVQLGWKNANTPFSLFHTTAQAHAYLQAARLVWQHRLDAGEPLSTALAAATKLPHPARQLSLRQAEFLLRHPVQEQAPPAPRFQPK